MGQITVRIDDKAIEYRERVTDKRGLRKSHFDNEVYNFYIQHHPIDPTGVDDDTDRKE